ncbi:hypothetical protein JOF36_000738 [Pseudonocardia parietis]|uniref:Uncharacterized protein n=1 Tax=Pseudonocardia parietis TaxID=570936 RepID=A0ABS4VM95_9PSEU|nr:hypothetical protein [Pseudonocardia parietis]
MTPMNERGGPATDGPAPMIAPDTLQRHDHHEGTAPAHRLGRVATLGEARSHRSKRHALDHLDQTGACACWTAGPGRRCLAGRVS